MARHWRLLLLLLPLLLLGVASPGGKKLPPGLVSPSSKRFYARQEAVGFDLSTREGCISNITGLDRPSAVHQAAIAWRGQPACMPASQASFHPAPPGSRPGPGRGGGMTIHPTDKLLLLLLAELVLWS